MRSRTDTTQKITQSAADLFLERGFSSVTMDVVAESASITKVTLYQHFRSKELLLLHCLRWRLSNREAYLDNLFAGQPSKPAQIMEIFDWMGLKAGKRNFQGCAFLKATNEMAATLPEVRTISYEAKLLLRQRIVEMLCSANIRDFEQLGDTLALLIEGAQALSLIEQSARPFQAARREAEALLVQSSKVSPAPRRPRKKG